MDRNYKPLFVAEVKACMKRRLPNFSNVSVPVGHVHRQIFSGALLYRWKLRSDAYVWLVWQPGPDVERYFHISIGWSRSPERFPCVDAHDARIHALRGPDSMFEAAALDLEQIEGESALGGITIPSPWDQLLSVKAAAPKAELDAAIRKAYAEASCLTNEERAEAVMRTIIDIFDRIDAVLPRFEATLLESTSVA